MELLLIDQARVFGATILTGALLGVLFDFYRVLREVLRPRGYVTAVADLLYWIVATAITILALLMCNWLELRMYVFLGLLSGAAAYYRLLSRQAIFMLARVLRLAGWLGTRLQRVLIYTLIKPVQLLLHILLFPFAKARQPAGRLWRKCRNWLAPKEVPPS